MNCAIYTYGGHERGMGHIYQSHALAQELEKEGINVQFLVPDVPEGVAKLQSWGHVVREIPHQVSDGEKIAHIERHWAGQSVDVAIVDILESSPVLMRHMAERAAVLISLDDIGEGRVWADLLINVIHHPPRPPQALYREVNELNYAVLRPEFYREHRRDKNIPQQAAKVLVSQGGSDTFGGIVPLAEALAKLPQEVEVHLLAGAAFRHDGPLMAAIKNSPRPFVLQRDVQDMAALLQQMDLAITGGGKTLFELSAVGVPFIAVTEEPRELETMDIVARHVLCVNHGLRRETGAERIAQTVCELVVDPDRRLAMSKSGKKAVDGRGAWRARREIAATLQEKRGVVRGSAL